MCYDMLLEIIDVADQRNDYRHSIGPTGATGASMSEKRDEEDGEE
jgi:hypothetical protein